MTQAEQDRPVALKKAKKNRLRIHAGERDLAARGAFGQQDGDRGEGDNQ